MNTTNICDFLSAYSLGLRARTVEFRKIYKQVIVSVEIITKWARISRIQNKINAGLHSEIGIMVSSIVGRWECIPLTCPIFSFFLIRFSSEQ
ncbi:hypothetical protein BO223_00820 [Faecalibaculum rodentium]|uniref:Uncharacterized protein n=1 Tax=Faecalibaculum rodentium TaxID=1702221 RepID=A0A1Q9YMW2_9FIRM|nr:hypothetical protein BO223_00820 [Faecalibaculum rodentium]